MPELALHILDLVQNSVSAGAARVTVTIVYDTAQDTLTITIEDDGKGMEAERLGKVRRLIDGEEEIDRSDPSGFGLFNVAQRLSLNYGSEYGISVDSVFGKGTRVTVVIPAVRE